MKILKTLALAPLAISLLAPAYASADNSCPAPTQIAVMGGGFGMPINPWISITSSGFGQGMGGDSVGSFTGSINLAPGMEVCFYGSSTHASPAELAKNINQVPEKARPYLKYLQDSTSGFLMFNSFSASK